MWAHACSISNQWFCWCSHNVSVCDRSARYSRFSQGGRKSASDGLTITHTYTKREWKKTEIPEMFVPPLLCWFFFNENFTALKLLFSSNLFFPLSILWSLLSSFIPFFINIASSFFFSSWFFFFFSSLKDNGRVKWHLHRCPRIFNENIKFSASTFRHGEEGFSMINTSSSCTQSQEEKRIG